MDDPHEIIVTLQDQPTEPCVVQFSELFDLRDNIVTMMHLWNSNSYYVDVKRRMFIINGGRKIVVNFPKECRLFYRRRNQFEKGMNSNNWADNRKANWLMGLEDKETGKLVFLQIAEDGHVWAWADKL